MHLRLEQAVTSLMYHSFCFSKSLPLGRKCVKFQWFFTDTAVLRWRQARNKHLRLIRIVGQIESGGLLYFLLAIQ